MKVLLVEDDPALAGQLQRELVSQGYNVDISADGEDGLYRAREYPYDLLIVDLGLPRISGLDVITTLRGEGCDLPVLILTARSSWQDKVYGLKAGADDYVAKPFQTEELLARVQVLLRRAGGYSNNLMQQGPIELDVESQTVRVDQQEVSLTAFEYRLLQYFMLHPNRVASKAVLADYLYDDADDRESNVIEVLVGRLRQKLDPDNQLKPIETLRGRGYRFALK